MSMWPRFLRARERIDTKFTPDGKDLEAKGADLIFIYDDMMRYRNEYPRIMDFVIECYGSGFTIERVEAFSNNSNGYVIAFSPRIIIKPNWCEQTYGFGAPIRGEILLVETEAIYKLDKLLENGVHYKRIPIRCEVWKEKYRGRFSEPNREYQAWIYLGIPDKWNIDSGYEWKPMTLRQTASPFTPKSYYYHQSRSQSSVT